MKVAFYTLGCKVNQYDTNAMSELFVKEGYEITNFTDFADIYVINTCTVTNTADKKSKNIIRRAYLKNKDAIICVCGCLAQRDALTLSKMPEVSVVLGTENRNSIIEIIKNCSENKNFTVPIKSTYEELKVSTSGELTSGYIKIQEGCNNFCSYCIIPYVRGRVRSRSIKSITEEATDMAKNNVKEIILTGIHISSYGIDTQENLIEVIKAIENIPQIKRIRLGSLEPHILTLDFLENLNTCKKLCDQFHVSLQSGSDEVLKKMNRKYTVKEYAQFIKNARQIFPKCAITTDIITGFPEETQENFIETCEFVKEIKFSRIHVFPYSKREGTKAALMAQHTNEEKKKRAANLILIAKKLENEYTGFFIGETSEVLFYKKLANGYYEGYSKNFLRVWAKDVKINECEIIYFKEVKDNIIIGEKS